ncbi:MAG: prolipoprotein diacylglyceryl transferase, partial [Chloroflexi bacterium]|nr:prolipoprotein diacylglyceryl transferase [Chloroflexota bacterium]
RWYSLTFAAGLLLAMILVLREARKRGLDSSKVSNVFIWAIVGGLVGARLFHVLDRLDYYLANPVHIIMVNEGGLAIWGGLLTGGVVAFYAARREGLAPLKLADASVIGMIAGQMVGRLGCIVNGDAYGGVTGLPWGFVYANPGALIPDALKGTPTHPYPVYEILWDAALLGILLLIRRRTVPDGSLFIMYAVGYGLGRFSLTFVRQEAVMVWGLQQAQVIALGVLALAAAGGAWLAWSSRPRSRFQVAEP